VHDASVVEDDVEPAPGVEVLDAGLDVGLFGDVAALFTTKSLAFII
jgi:hypothetical protein